MEEHHVELQFSKFFFQLPVCCCQFNSKILTHLKCQINPCQTFVEQFCVMFTLKEHSRYTPVGRKHSDLLTLWNVVSWCFITPLMSSTAVFGTGSETPDVANSFGLQFLGIRSGTFWHSLVTSLWLRICPKVINTTIKSELCSALENYEKPGEKGDEL